VFRGCGAARPQPEPGSTSQSTSEEPPPTERAPCFEPTI